MPYATPTLTALRQQAVQDIIAAKITNSAGLKIVGLLQKGVLRVLALLLADYAYSLYDQQRYMALQTNPFTATDEYAAAWGALKGVTQKDAVASTGSVTFSNSVNTTPLPLGSTINRYDGAQYITTAAGAVSGTTVTVPVVAAVPGQAGTINIGDACQLSPPVSGINGNTGIFTATTVIGADQETFNAFKARYLVEYSSPPQGGSASDYVEWATGVPGVTRAWTLPNYNITNATTSPGVVSVLFMEDNTQSAHAGFPQGSNGVSSLEPRNTGTSGTYPLATGDQLALANAIEPLRPVTALLLTASPTGNPVSFSITGEVGPIPTAIQGLITTALQQMFLRVATPGGTTRPDGGTGGDIYPSDWDEAITSVPGVPPFVVTVPSSTVTSSFGAIPYLSGTPAFS
jgi:uncharacterized phage protein gp47/JayE